MRTVKEVSELTGISVRTLHWYDEIGLLAPTATSEAGYRLYDDKALETLQQILFFREFDIPLRDIKSIMENPGFDRDALLCSQKRVLEQKKARLERLISGIDDILKGENRMDFTIFSRTELEEMYQGMVESMTGDYREHIIEAFGSMEQYKKQFLESAESEQAQKNFQKVVEWYGDKEEAFAAMKKPKHQQVLPSYQKRIDTVMKKLAGKNGCDVCSFEVKELIGEYDFVTKQLYQLKDAGALVLELAKEYQSNRNMREALDAQYGTGTAAFFADAVNAFYKRGTEDDSGDVNC